MIRKIKHVLYLFIIVLFVLATLPFLKKRKSDPKLLNDATMQFYESNNQAVILKLITTPTEAFDSRIALIESAKETIDMSYYRIADNDETTQIILGALLKAADRGVTVNIVVDAKFGGLDSQTIRLLNSKESIHVYFYNPLNVKKPESLQVSLHNKVMIVDKKWALSGGRNISDAFLKESNAYRHISYDLDVLLYAKNKEELIMHQFQTLFDELILEENSRLMQKLPNKQTSVYKKRIEKKYEEYSNDHNTVKQTIDKFKDTMYPVEKVSLIYSSTEPVHKDPIVAQTLYELAKEYKGDIIIQSPYIIADDLIIQAFDQLLATHTLTIYTNSLSSSPNYPAFSNYLLHRGKLVKRNLDLFEYLSDGTTSIHTKAYRLGDGLSAVGSMNLDNRSLFINTEQMLIIQSEKFEQSLMSTIKHQQMHSVKVNKNLKKHTQRYEFNVPLMKRIMMKFVGIILRLFQNFL